MRIATLNQNGKQVLGVRRGENYVDLSKAAADLPHDMTALLAADALGKANEAAQSAADDALIAANGATYLPLVTNPPKILCCGLNYRDHAEETGNPIP
nr:5-carboxymethyl-2-hydroxymuconate isomerase [Alphaproteobacteria bacterium]